MGGGGTKWEGEVLTGSRGTKWEGEGSKWEGKVLSGGEGTKWEGEGTKSEGEGTKWEGTKREYLSFVAMMRLLLRNRWLASTLCVRTSSVFTLERSLVGTSPWVM